MPEAALEALAADAYIYGIPLVSDLTLVEAFRRRGFGSLPPTDFNRFGHAGQLAVAGTELGSVNNDTVYSVAQLDLSGGPLLLHVPDTAGAYYVLQFVDAWTNTFAYVGRRATGTAEQTWLIVPPAWHGTPAVDARVITAPTTVVSIVGRLACDGPADLPRVRALQQQLTITPLEPGGVYAGLPQPDPDVPGRLEFFERLRVWMAAFPPAEPDREYQQRFAPLGLLDTGRSPYADADPGWTAALANGLVAGKQRIEEATRTPEGHPIGDWSLNLHLFDYNLDHFGPGTLDTPAWRIADRRAAYLTRAVAGRAGLCGDDAAPWCGHAYEAVHASTYVDSEGKQLSGARSYTLRLDSPPPVEAFWSITMYDLPDFQLVDNPIDRYSIGDRTPGLVRGEDGSLTLVLQHDPPTDPTEAANWLPAPIGEFRPMLRMYLPQAAVLNGSYRLPLIEPR